MKISPDFSKIMTVTEKAFILTVATETEGDKIDPIMLIKHTEIEDITRL
jgi:hypothetical protein